MSDKDQHPAPSIGRRVTKEPVQQDREPLPGGQASVGAEVAYVEGQPCRDDAGDGATVEDPPTRRPCFRDRPRHWWWLSLTGRYPSSGSWAGTVNRPRYASPTDDAGAPTVATPGTGAAVVQRRRRRLRGLIAAALGLILLGAALLYYLTPAMPSRTPAPTPSPPIVFAPLAGPSIPVLAVLGAQSGLSDPREAVALPGSHIVVADTGHSRLVVLDRAGHLLRTIRSGLTALQQPYAVVAVPGGVDVLDADRGSIDYFDSSGHFVREIAHDPAVHIARGMAVGPDGRLYVANPLTNSIAVLSANGQVIRQIQSALSTKPGQFNQPSAVAVGPTGTIYVLDNQNNRIEALTPSGSFLAQWSAPPSNTMHSVHLLVLPDGRLLATDPSGALLVYHPGGGSPTRMPLLLNGQTLPSVQLVGLSHMTGNKVLLTDSRGGQLFVVSVPR